MKLKRLISEDDDEEVKKKDAFAGKTNAGSSKYWYVNKQGQMKAVVNPPSEGGWELADKDQAKEAEEREKDIEVDIDDEAREFINKEMESQGFKLNPEDENSFVDDEGDEMFHIDADGEIALGDGIRKFNKKEQEGYADYIEDVNDKVYDKKGGDERPDRDDESDYRDIYKTDIAGKDKSLSDVDSLQTEVFTEPIIPDDKVFDAKNKKNKFPEPPPAFKMPKIDGGDYPQKYNDLIERLVNTKLDDETSQISYFMESSAGAGKISSQAGEILTTALTSLDDDQAKKLESSLLEHLKAQKDADPKAKKIVDPSWVKAAMDNREAIRNRIAKEYPEGSKIVASAWDVKEEVNALGMEDYEGNKGFSTDVYFKVETPDGNTILDEVSLKKDIDVNFLNSGTKKFKDWDENLSEELDQTVYTGEQRKRLNNFVKKNRFLIESALKKDKALQKEFKSKGIKDIDDLLSRKPSRAVMKIMMRSAESVAATGDRTAEKFVKDHKKQSKIFSDTAVEALANNEKLKEGMLSEIREEFPLKAVADGEETMAIGPYSLDPAIMKHIFGTNDFNKIKEKLVAVKAEPPYVGYQAEVGGDTIPIASIDIREDGVGYGSVFKFDMKLDKRFATTLKEANAEVYKEAVNLLANILFEAQENTLAFHWKKAEDDYPLHYFLRDLNEGSLN